jgi:CubicO group peptidase (beta-lactamase class C family)
VRPRDLARLGQVVADGGASEGTQIIPAAWIDDIVRNGSADAWDAGGFAPFFPGRKMHYRNKWYADLGEAPLLFALGIHGQYLFVDRRNQLVIVMMSSQADPLDAELISLTMTAVSHIREIFTLSR